MTMTLVEGKKKKKGRGFSTARVERRGAAIRRRLLLLRELVALGRPIGATVAGLRKLLAEVEVDLHEARSLVVTMTAERSRIRYLLAPR